MTILEKKLAQFATFRQQAPKTMSIKDFNKEMRKDYRFKSCKIVNGARPPLRRAR